MPTLTNLPLAFRALFTSFLLVLGIAYLMALAYMFLAVVEPHQKMGQGLIEGIEVTYHGDPTSSRMETALRGSMADQIQGPDRDRVLAWVHNGAPESDYAALKPIFDTNCIACHSAESGMGVAPLDTYEGVLEMSRIDQGPTITQLARVSHVHLFGISVFFLLTGAIFALSSTPAWFRATVVVLPYLAIIADIGSWWLTKFFPVFGVVVVMGGALMAISMGLQVLISLWEMWLPAPWARKRVEAAESS